MTKDSKQYLFIIRHGDRWDYAYPDWKSEATSRLGDAPLSPLGHQQAQEVGRFLDKWLRDNKIQIDNVVWMSSPFLRCLQTCDQALNVMGTFRAAQTLPILPEYSIFEWDGHGGEWHRDLPTLTERKHYFPRLATDYQSFFIPTLPGKHCRKHISHALVAPSHDAVLFQSPGPNFSSDVGVLLIVYTNDIRSCQIRCW
jgi:hypothetical protein